MKTASVLGLAGGFAYGAQQAGCQLVGMWENGFGQDLAMANLPEVPYRDESRSNPPRGLDLVVGCPPCAGWSAGSAGLDQLHNPSHAINDGIRRWFEAVEASLPQLAVFECVTALAHNGGELWRPLSRRLEEKGYSWKIVHYDNQWLGVPQRRKRMLFWAYRGHGELDFPAWWGTPHETPVGPALLTNITKDWWDWHEEVDPRRAAHRLFPWIEPGRNIRKVPVDKYWALYHDDYQRPGWPSFTFRRLHYGQPAPAMMGNALAAILHPRNMYLPDLEADIANSEVRLITGRELARIMGYPDDFLLEWDGVRHTSGDRNNLAKWLCQAVSPTVGRWVGLTASAYLEQSVSNEVFDGGMVDLGTPP